MFHFKLRTQTAEPGPVQVPGTYAAHEEGPLVLVRVVSPGVPQSGPGGEDNLDACEDGDATSSRAGYVPYCWGGEGG